jgi:hypothetical protein
MLHVALMQTGMPVPCWGAGQTRSQPPQLFTSRFVSRQPAGQLIWPLGHVAQSVPAALHPFGHCIVGAVHVPAALQVPCGVTTPFAHDCAGPHSVPEPLLPLSTQTGAPVAQDVTPVLHGLVGWQAWFAVHDTQLPPLQTRFVPQLVPSVWFCPLSVQVGVPVEQFSVPV